MSNSFVACSGLISMYAVSEANKTSMWGGRPPTSDEADQLAKCFTSEWEKALNHMLQHWSGSPTWVDKIRE